VNSVAEPRDSCVRLYVLDLLGVAVFVHATAAIAGVTRTLRHQAGRAVHTLHQPPAGTLWPAKIVQPAVASVGLPWY